MGADAQIYDTKLPKDATNSDLHIAYDNLKDKALYDYGHRRYTGSIAEADGWKIRRNLEYTDQFDVMRHVDDFAEKWGPAVAVFVRDTNTWHFAGIFSS
jgi:hypothetical protein